VDGRAALWTFVGVFVFFKLATTAMIIAADPAGLEKVLWFFVALHWPVMVAGAAIGTVFFAVWALFRFRLLRVRARRKQLQAAEWRAD
jgi:hypothetical protein